jgi:hypothetical protein
MPKRRSRGGGGGGAVVRDDRQSSFIWRDPAHVLENTPDRGEIVYEAPELSRLARSKPGRSVRVRVAPAAGEEILSLGLPFGVRKTDGRAVCWSCSRELDESSIVRTGPGYARCPGCGAKIPFAE